MTTANESAILADYRDSFQKTWSDAAAPEEVRFVVLDCETTGLDPRRDRIVSIGAVAVRAGDVVLDDSFEALLKIDHNLSAVTVHGITRDQARSGLDEKDALLGLVAYLADGVIVGHHIGHDLTAMNVALERHFGLSLQNRSLDTMELTLHLERAGAFDDGLELRSFSLDALCGLFDVTPHDRHTAPGDALLTALVFLKLLRLGRHYGRADLRALCERFQPAGAPDAPS